MSGDEGRAGGPGRKRRRHSPEGRDGGEKRHKESRGHDREARKEKDVDRRARDQLEASGEDERKRKRDRERERADKEQRAEKERDRERERAHREREAREASDRERREQERRDQERLERERAERDRKERQGGRDRDRGRGRRSRSRDRGRDRADRGHDDGWERDHHRSKKRRAEGDDRQHGEGDRYAQDEPDIVDERRKRVKLWQLQQAAKMPTHDAFEEEQNQKAKWSLEDEADDDDEEPAPQPPQDMEEGGDEVDPLDAYMQQNDAVAQQQIQAAVKAEEEEEVDPLDAFMETQVKPALAAGGGAGGRAPEEPQEVKPVVAGDEGGPGPLVRAVSVKDVAKAQAGKRRQRRPRMMDSDSSSGYDTGNEPESDDEAWVKDVTAGKKTKGDKLIAVDHSKINYEPFRRSFYIEVPDLAKMTGQEVKDLRKSLDNIKVKGRDIPKPVKNWNQCGLSGRILDVLKKNGFAEPMPIQAQALPVIMSGRDCIGVAKTGSGKTLAFILPMLRHIKDQRPLAMGEGPIALIIAPTRELAVQIGKEVKKFAGHLDLRHVCAYGGSSVGPQISELKRGAEIVICTPGRAIDILTSGGGKVLSLRRVTYLVVDEADRMFDMGFEPQIQKIILGIRPDRQTVLFSATFPRSVEALARQVLQSPIEIEIGGRSVVNSDIDQRVEIREDGERFMRLLEILGEYYERGKVLVFVEKQNQCDELFHDLVKVGYPCLSLHGGKDQSDRESTINDFKTAVCNLLIATSVAARGLDVKDLNLVVNYNTPSHHEDYIHRVGRTGRAGNKGTAITFIAREDEQFAPDLVKALKESGAGVPADLLEMAESFAAKRRAGTVHAHGSGYGGSGFKFNEAEDEARKAARKAAAKDAAKDAGMSDSDEEGGEGEIRLVKPGEQAAREAAAAAAAANAAGAGDLDPVLAARRKAAEETAARLTMQAFHAAPAAQAPAFGQPDAMQLIAAAQAAANQANRLAGLPGNIPAAMPTYSTLPGGIPGSMAPPEKAPHYELELSINDFPQHARWKVTHKDSMAAINELTGAAVTTKGRYFAPGQPVPEGEIKLLLLIEGPTVQCVKAAKAAIKRILEESTERAFQREAPTTGRYNVL